VIIVPGKVGNNWYPTADVSHAVRPTECIRYRTKGNRKTVLGLRWLPAGHPPRRPVFDPGSVYVGFVVDKVTLGQGFSPEYFGFPSVSFIPPVLHYLEKDKK
jgi:hypothetical protein